MRMEHGSHDRAPRARQEGKLTEAEYRQSVRDLVNFLDYMGEPIRLERQHLVSGWCCSWSVHGARVRP